MPDLSSQFARYSESQDYHTGRRLQYYDFDVPDRLAHEPHGIRVRAQEHGRNAWTITSTHGPYDERDERGSYYRSSPDVADERLEAPASKAKARIRALGNAELRRMLSRRGG